MGTHNRLLSFPLQLLCKKMLWYKYQKCIVVFQSVPYCHVLFFVQSHRRRYTRTKMSSLDTDPVNTVVSQPVQCCFSFTANFILPSLN